MMEKQLVEWRARMKGEKTVVLMADKLENRWVV